MSVKNMTKQEAEQRLAYLVGWHGQTPPKQVNKEIEQLKERLRQIDSSATYLPVRG